MNGPRPSVARGPGAAGLVLLVAACNQGGVGTDSPAGGSGGAVVAASGGSGTGTGGVTGSGGVLGSGGAVGSGGVAGSGGHTGGSGGSGGDPTSGTGGQPPGPVTLHLMESVVFYDGYAAVADEPVPEGVTRLDNSLFTTRLTDVQLSQIQPHLQLDVTIGALCDNYDRIGSVRLALTPKGAASYDPAATPHIELGRFITPFMDKNAEPTTVPYTWNVDHVAAILRSPALALEYDFWLEFSVFGVPYAANEEVAGCSGRSDVFSGSVAMTTESTAAPREVDVLLPLAFQESFNDYQSGASDQIGVATKTLDIDLEADLEDAELVFIISHHGANSGGEEYERREHFVLLDGESVLEFTPGRTSCEPFRMYNTQGNGIYGPTPRSDAEWQSFSNWCPGDVIDIRCIPWGSAAAGPHELVIDVPDAVFTGDEGNFPLSVFVLGRAAAP